MDEKKKMGIFPMCNISCTWHQKGSMNDGNDASEKAKKIMKKRQRRTKCWIGIENGIHLMSVFFSYQFYNDFKLIFFFVCNRSKRVSLSAGTTYERRHDAYSDDVSAQKNGEKSIIV